MRNAIHIRRNDVVIARHGRNAAPGRTGKVLMVMPGKSRAIVEGLNLVKKALRKSEAHPKGGITDKEAPLPVCNLQLYCPTCKKGVRVRREKKDGKNVRKCKRCGHAFD